MLVHFEVGPQKTRFTVHQSILFAASPVFRSAFRSQFKEADDRSMSLPDEDADLYEHFLTWLYADSFQLLHPPDKVASDTVRLVTTARLYVLADKYDIVKLRNDICQAFFPIPRHYRGGPPTEVTEIIYRETSVNCRFRRFLADW